MSIIDAVSNAASPKRRLNIVKNPLAENLVKEWHPTKNSGIPVDQISAQSNRKVWWLGECGHEWEAIVANRSLGRGCSYCSGKYLLRGFNDLLTLKPLVASQFHPTKNGNLNVEDLMVGSNKKVWWLNPVCGHEWEMKVSNRNDHVACSVCDGFIVQAGINDLATTHPEIAKYLHPTKNASIDTTKLGAGSGLKVWWLGDCGHEWQAIINNRSGRGDGCIYCSGYAVLEGFNDLSTAIPELVKEWHPTKNLPLTPQAITIGSGKKIWWQCPKSHEWQTTVGSRAKGGHACPYCTGRNTVIGANDLLTLNPALSLEWHTEKNFPLLPSEVKEWSSKKVWWICHKNHEWLSTVNDRSRGQGCPTCAAHRFISKAEQEIADFIKDQGLIIKQTDRLTVKGMEMDIYIPEKNFAIEYNGLYWHSDLKISDNNYHYNKWLMAKNKGIQLVQIWEDEWNKNPDQIKTMLLHKLGISQQEKVFARKTYVEKISKSDIERFLTLHHIQGFASASIYLGLKEKENHELVSVLALKKEAHNALNIIRYSTSKNVIGGFTKLLSYSEREFKPAQFITFSDHCVSDGNLYASNGFTKDKELKPDYRYVVKFQRKHKFGYRIKKFKDDPGLIWEEGLTERELASLNGIPRIWDAGKTKWVKQVVK